MSSVKERLLVLGQRLSALAQEHELDEAWSIRAELIGIAYSQNVAALREQPEARGVVDVGPEPDEFDQSPEDLATWLDRKHARHGEDEDRQAASMLRRYAALTAAQQPVQEGGGEVAAWMTPESIAHLAKQNGVAKVDAWNCASGSERVPVYTAPPSAPVGDRREIDRVIRELRAYNPAADEYRGEHIHGVWAKELERALAQQPAQAAPGEFVVVDGRSYALDTVRTALLGLAADVAATPPGDDAAGGGHD